MARPSYEGTNVRTRITPLLLLLVLAAAAAPAGGQEPPRGAVTIRVLSDSTPVKGAEVRSGTLVRVTDARGEATLRLPAGERSVAVRRLGFAPAELRVDLRAGADTTVEVHLQEQAIEEEAVVVSTTRGARRVEDEPTRVEVLGHEEVEEKTAMVPGSVAHLLSETGGVKLAQSSPAFGAMNIRVQGLRGRYTQLLSDGLPLFGLTTEGLGLLQIPPLDLDHVELIKGAASALYGPTALGGVVNLVSRRVGEGPATRQLLLNQTSRDGTDGVFYGSGELSERWGYSLLASLHRQSRRDLNGDGWADLPSYRRVVVRPRLFWKSAGGASLLLTSGFTAEDRTGGGLVPPGLPFTEKRDTRRADAGAVGRFLLGGPWLLTVRGSVTGEWRRQGFGPGFERDLRSAMFGEAAVRATHGAHDVVLGAALTRDALDLKRGGAVNYAFVAPGIFAQDTWTPTEWFGLTASGRADFHSEYGTFLSPRVSVLVRPARGWNARLSAGGGEYAPTPFVEETEEIGLARLRPFVGRLGAERAWSAGADAGGVVGPLELSGSIYASVIRHPVALRAVEETRDSVELVNLGAPTRTRGDEFVAIYRLRTYRLTGTYAYLHATEQDPETGLRRGVPLTPLHSAGLMASWEPKDDSGLGLEGFYTGRQPLAEDPYRTRSRPYAQVGALARWRFGRLMVYVNGENLTDVRQTRWEPLLRATPGLGGRWTVDAWAPLEGRMLNTGVRWRF